MNKSCLTKKQEKALKSMSEGKNVFITGMSGSGKSHIIKFFKNMCCSTRTIGITSTTGTSALLIGGTTIHSFLGIGLGRGDIDFIASIIFKKKYLRKRWMELDVLIIDEISMMTPELFDKIEAIARIVRLNECPFGGIQLIITGDGLQLPCIDSEKMFFQAESWNKCIDETIYLTEIIRQSDPKFQKCLNEVRVANMSVETIDMLNSRVGAILENEYDIKPTRLFSKNIKVDEINDRELDALANDELEFREYIMEYEYFGFRGDKEMLTDKFRKCCIAPEILQICIGAQVMLLKNIDVEDGLVNGSRGIVINFYEDIPVVTFLSGKEIIIDYSTWDMEENNKVVIQAKQIPLKVAYAISIHKVQGTTLDYAEMDLSDVFTYGQAYVALSRVTSLHGLSITALDISKIKAHPLALDYYKKLEALAKK